MANVDFDRIAREIIAEAIATDEAEDEEHGDARGDELPPELQTEAGRREWLAREQAEAGEHVPAGSRADEVVGEFDPERIGRTGRRGLVARSAPPARGTTLAGPAAGPAFPG